MVLEGSGSLKTNEESWKERFATGSIALIVPRKGHKRPNEARERETERARPNFRDDFEDIGQER